MEFRPDEELVSEAKKGGVRAFTDLAARYQQRIYSTVFSMTRSHQDADDLTQETFLQAFRSLKSFRGKSSFYTWIYRIAVNLTLNVLKKRGKERSGEEKLLFAARTVGEGASSSPESLALRRELRDRLDEAVAGLPVPYRTAFILVARQGLSHGQAAEILGCAENTVSWRMHKARQMLQDRLAPYLMRGKT